MIFNPTTIRWTAPTAYADGSAFGSADFAGYEFGFRPLGATSFTPTVSVPVSFAQTSLDLSALALPQLVEIELAMRTVAANGQASDFAIAPDTIRFDTRRPLAPSGFSVA